MKSSILWPVLFYVVSLIAAPLLPGLISKIKALFAGREGQPILQPYYDLFRLWKKGAVYSRTTSALFYIAPLITMAAMLAALSLFPVSAFGALLSFQGDLILFGYLFGLARFISILAALDTGSSFEGMGASREATFSIFNEVAFFLVLATLVKQSGSLSLSAMALPASITAGASFNPAMPLLSVTMFIVLLSENYRIPVDDPTTHLELTMIHEVMVLDHSGPDLAFILYGASLKMWMMAILASFVLLSPLTLSIWAQVSLGFVLTLTLALLIGIIESVMARFRLSKIPQFLVGATILGLIGYIITK